MAPKIALKSKSFGFFRGVCGLARLVLSVLDMSSFDRRSTIIPLERMPVRDVLGTVDPFTAVSAEELDDLCTSVMRVRKTAGAIVLEEGQVPDALYVILRGRINLVREGQGRDLILSALGPGDVLGENCAFDNHGSSTSAVAATPAELLRIPAETLATHLRRNPETMVALMRLLTDKLRDIENVASSLALYDVEERLRRTLIRLAQRQGRRSPASSELILAPVPTQSELARMVGSCRETVSRTLSAMARNGLVTSSGRRLILDHRLMDPVAAA